MIRTSRSQREFSSQQAIDAVVRSANRTMLLVSGGEKAGEEAMLDKARQAMEAGATGLIFGRNVWQRGDRPGLNAAIRAVARTAEGQYGDNVIGYRHGWLGAAESDSVELTGASTHAILAAGGTMLGPRATTRTSTRASPNAPWTPWPVITLPRCWSWAGTVRDRRRVRAGRTALPPGPVIRAA